MPNGTGGGRELYSRTLGRGGCESKQGRYKRVKVVHDVGQVAAKRDGDILARKWLCCHPDLKMCESGQWQITRNMWLFEKLCGYDMRSPATFVDLGGVEDRAANSDTQRPKAAVHRNAPSEIASVA
jgi:hypothetical protein